jgi:site-specific DNA recombinase
MTTFLRIAAYCRTSSEGQRDNTSIPRQREDIEAYCTAQGWTLIQVYVDESKSGSKVEGRDEFQKMMRDAANEVFDAVVVYDITRFARNGADIIDKARFLKSTFGIFLVDTKGHFDNRQARNALTNHVHAGISEHERLSIMERTIGGRIVRAKNGEPWGGSPPFGRAYDKKTRKWYVTEAGYKMRSMLERYAEGEHLGEMFREYGFGSPTAANRIIRDVQLSGTYIARFHAPEIDIVNIEVLVPAVPEIITPELAERVRQRSAHNRTNNKENLRKYKLTGYVRCGTCGEALTSAYVNGYQYYRHRSKSAGGAKHCNFRTVRAALLEEHALGFLYSFYTDEPAFEQAVRQAMPTTEQRDAVAAELERARGAFAKAERSIANLIRAIEDGADTTMLINRQQELRAERDECATRVDVLDRELASMPSVATVARRAKAIRIMLVQSHSGKDWRAQEFDDIRQFMRFLFGDNPRRNGYGISVSRVDGGWRVGFEGRVRIDQVLHNGSPTALAFRRRAQAASNLLQTEFDIAIAKANQEYAADLELAEALANGTAKPYIGNMGPMGPMGPMGLWVV